MKTKKMIAIWMTAGIIMVSLAGCGGKDDTAKTAAGQERAEDTADAKENKEDKGASEGPVRLGIVVKSLSDQYYTLLKKGAEDRAEEVGNIELTVIAPNSEADVQKQVENVETLLAKGVDVIGIAPAHNETLLPVLQQAVEQGVKVMAVDNDTTLEEKVTFIGTENETAAYEGAKWAGKQIGEGGNAIVLRGKLGDSNHDEREAGLQKGLEETGINVLEIQTADCEEQKGLQVTENLIQKYDNIDLVITTADTMSMGAYRAIEQAGMTDKIQVYGFDGQYSFAKLIAEGKVLGTTAQDPYTMGIIAVDTAVSIANGEEVNPRIDSGQIIVTQENGAEFVKDLESKLPQ